MHFSSWCSFMVPEALCDFLSLSDGVLQDTETILSAKLTKLWLFDMREVLQFCLWSFQLVWSGRVGLPQRARTHVHQSGLSSVWLRIRWQLSDSLLILSMKSDYTKPIWWKMWGFFLYKTLTEYVSLQNIHFTVKNIKQIIWNKVFSFVMISFSYDCITI